MIYSASYAAHAKSIDLRQANNENDPSHCRSRRVGHFNKQVLLGMKLMAVLLLITCLQVSAKGYGQGTVTISLRDVLVTEVFKEIEKQTSFRFLYRDELVKKAGVISINVKNAPVAVVLDRCFNRKPLEYKIFKETIVISEKGSSLTTGGGTGMIVEPLINVSGKVIDEQGRPVENVTVTIKGTNKSTLTNSNGEFFLNSIEQDAVLLFSSVNMEPFEVKVNGQQELAITLKTKITSLSDVVISVPTGYDKISKERFTGSYAQLDSQSFHRRVGMNIIDRLDGTIPGVLFDRKGSALLSAVQVRGYSSLGNEGTPTGPLIVIDNFPMPDININNINPNDVESITVLKDAVAASIWGARAGNGVIVVTTKKGKYNQRFHLDVSSNITIDGKPDLYYYDRIRPSDFIGIEQFLFGEGFYDAALSNFDTYPVVSPVVEILERQRSGLITPAEATAQINAFRNHDVRNDMDSYLYRRQVRQQHYISVNGGANNLAYQLSVGYNRTLNNIKGSRGDDQFTANFNSSFRPIKRLEIQAGINFTLNDGRSNSFALPGSVFPYAKLIDENGDALPIPFQYRVGYIDTAGSGQLLDWHYRPLDEIRLANNKSITTFLRLNAGLTYRFTDWISANVSFQQQYVTTNQRNLKGIEIWETRNLINQFTNPNVTNPNLRYPIPVGGILDVSSSVAKIYNVRGTINFNKSFGPDHQVTALIGGEVSDSKGGYGSSNRYYGYNPETGSYRDNMDYYNMYPKIYANSPGTLGLIPRFSGYADLNTNRFVSLLGNASYTFRNRYNVYASARKDGANVFGVNTNNKWKPLWSAGASWDISKESFYKVSWMPSLRVRTSYGYTGNSNNTLSGLFIINFLTITDPINANPISQPGRAPNKDLKWEEVRIVNFGVDFQVLKGRLGGAIEVYKKRSNDVIAAALMAPSTGVVSYMKNFASMKTNGYEIALFSRNTQGRIEWTTNVNWTRAKTTVTQLNTTLGLKASDFIEYNINPVPGRVIYGISSYRWAGLDPATGDPQGFLNKAISKNYQGIFNDSIQNQIFHGSALPLSWANIRNNISWKGFTLSFNITGRFNYYFREPALTIMYTADVIGTNYGTDYYTRWQKPGDEKITNVPSFIFPQPGDAIQRDQFYRNTEINVKRADNIKLQDISLSYQWRNRDNKSNPFQTIKIYLYPNNLNLILWRKDDSKFDPDISGGSGGIGTPIPKTWTAGVTVNL